MEVSKCGSSLNQTSGKNLKMKELIEAINEYVKIRTENTAFIIKKFLQAYSVTIDLSVFDPDSNLGAQFYVSLYELLMKIEPESQTAWDCVDVLSNACKNCSAREALIKTYQFLPALARLMSDQLSGVKKKKLLKLLQDTTCGIQLSWQVPHLAHLLQMLTKWVDDKDQENVCLALGVLVNVCYKNLPAIYTLSRIVDIKKFLRYCLPLRGPLVEVNVCKLMIIVDQTHDDIPKKTLLNLIEPTFSSMLECLTKNDPVMLRLVVDFFIDMAVHENADVLKEYPHYNDHLTRLIQLIEARNTSTSDAAAVAQHDPECVRLILKFIYNLEIKKLGNLSGLYSKIIKLALDWMDSELVSHQALIVLIAIIQNSIQINDGGGDKDILGLLTAKLQFFIVTLTSEATPNNMEGYKRLGALLQLFKTLLKSSVCKEVLQALSSTVLQKVFSPVLSDELNLNDIPKIRIDNNVTSSTDVIDSYVYAIGLVNDLSQHDASWFEFLSALMENRNVHSILAQALYSSQPSIKQLVLEISKYPRFPTQKVATAMHNTQNMFVSPTKPPTACTPSVEMNYPILSVPQMEMLDETLKKFKKLVDSHTPTDIPVRQVMELYEYKLASLAHSERSALSSIEAASERCVHLQHRLAQLTTEHNKLRQTTYQTETRLEKMHENIEDMKKLYSELKHDNNTEIAKREKILADTEMKLKENKLRLVEMTDLKTNLEQQLEKCNKVIKKLEDSGQRVEKQLQKREEQLKNANMHLDQLNLQNQDLQKVLSQKEAKLAEVTKQYLASKEIITTITQMAMGSQLP